MEVPEEHMGAVVELLGKRRGQMIDMQGVGYVNCHICFYLHSPLCFSNYLLMGHNGILMREQLCDIY